jgi:hypothetical protein
MHPLNEQLQNPLTRRRDARDRARLVETFPALTSCSDRNFLALRCYVDATPERFFDRKVYQTFLDWLKGRDEADSGALMHYMSEAAAEIDGALLALRRTNSESWHDELLQSDDYDMARFVDQYIHPAYLRLVEAVLTPLSRPVAYFSRVDRGKSADGLDIWNVSEELAGDAADSFFRPYRQIIRNGLAHGGATFLPSDIRYRDKKGNEETFGTRSVVRLCDDLLE